MVLIFDLDNTLYDEASFVKSGFLAVSDYLAGITLLNRKKIYFRLLELLELHGRGKTFDMFLDEHSLLTKKNIKKCISVYRSHKPNIKLYPKVRNVLKNFSNHKLYLVTDGNKLVQYSKINALGIKSFFIKTFITGFYGVKANKPSLYCFKKIKQLEGCKWSDMVYVGDDPSKDFVNLNKVGAKTVRTFSGRYAKIKVKNAFEAKFKIENISKFSLDIFI
jgi:putative hydrolase of the HAD superfamily